MYAAIKGAPTARRKHPGARARRQPRCHRGRLRPRVSDPETSAKVVPVAVDPLHSTLVLAERPIRTSPEDHLYLAVSGGARPMTIRPRSPGSRHAMSQKWPILGPVWRAHAVQIAAPNFRVGDHRRDAIGTSACAPQPALADAAMRDLPGVVLGTRIDRGVVAAVHLEAQDGLAVDVEIASRHEPEPLVERCRAAIDVEDLANLHAAPAEESEAERRDAARDRLRSARVGRITAGIWPSTEANDWLHSLAKNGTPVGPTPAPGESLNGEGRPPRRRRRPRHPRAHGAATGPRRPRLMPGCAPSSVVLKSKSCDGARWRRHERLLRLGRRSRCDRPRRDPRPHRAVPGMRGRNPLLARSGADVGGTLMGLKESAGEIRAHDGDCGLTRR